MSDDASTFDDGRGRYPDAIRARVPRGLRSKIRHAAAAENVTLGEFVRRALFDRVASVTADNDDDPGPFSPGRGERIAA